MKKKILIIINPVSGKGDAEERKKTIVTAAKKYGAAVTLAETTPSVTALKIAAKAIKEGIEQIIVCGGDGTVMEVVGAAVQKKVILSVVPLGTGNLFAKNLDIPTDLAEALVTAFTGKVVKIDVGQANDRYFTIIAGIGLDADIMNETDHGLKNKFGIIAYILSGIKSLGNSSGRYNLSIDGKKLLGVKAKSIMVANMGKITGGIQAVPGANPQSGALKLAIIHASSISHWLSLLAGILAGNVNKSPHYKLYGGKKITIESLDKARVYECDGENFSPVKLVNITIFPHSLSVMVPN